MTADSYFRVEVKVRESPLQDPGSQNFLVAPIGKMNARCARALGRRGLAPHTAPGRGRARLAARRLARVVLSKW